MSKFISDQKQYIKKQFLALAAFSSSAVEYRNFEFVDEVIDAIVVDEENLEQEQVDRKYEKQINLLCNLFQCFSLCRYKTRKLFRIK